MISGFRGLFLLLLIGVPAAAQVPQDGVEQPAMFAERRAEFLRRLDSGVAVFHARPVLNRNDDVDYPYRQDSDFYYLTGFEEPEAVAVLSADEGKPGYTLFVRPRNPDEEVWTGFRWGPERAKEVFRADQAFVLDSLPAVMPRLLRGASRVLYSSAGDLDFGPRLREWTGPAAAEGGGVQPDAETPGQAGFPSPLPIVHEMRLIKSPEEVARIQRAIDVTEQAHRASMRAATPGLHEYDLEALQYYLYRTLGARRFGFPSIVGSGPNSTTLHYEENSRVMREGEVMVIDIGAEYAMYSADVTRTIPVSGRFTPEQREIYQIIVDAQDAAFRLMRPGHTMGEASLAAARVVTEGLVRLGILKGSVEENLQSGAFQDFYMHGLSHWLGLDVHDAGSYTEPDGSPRAFRPGMVLSNEPGIYIRDGWPGVDPKWYDIGVRIENDVLVTEGDPVDMTARIPRSIADVEAEMAKPPLVLETGEVGPPLPLPPGPGAAEAPEPDRRAAVVAPPGADIDARAGKKKRAGGS
ncbi:MAG TPA: aminopeptidase P N-terminal domain-containing protein [Gemmatimonadota bacterium]|jgi:Xaa-Pro aminopeptidase